MRQTFFINTDNEDHSGVCDVAAVRLDPEHFGGSSWGDQRAEMKSKESKDYCVAWIVGDGMDFNEWIGSKGYTKPEEEL